MNQPETTCGDRVFISFAQESDVVCVFELLQASRVASELPVEEPDGTGVLAPAMDEFNLALAPDLLCYGGRRHGQADRQQRKEQHDDNQKISGLRRAAGSAAEMRMKLHETATTGSKELSADCC